MQSHVDTQTASGPIVIDREPRTGGKPLAWYVAYTLPRQETVAQMHLQRQGFQTYLPLYKKARKSSASKSPDAAARPASAAQEPMFPRYLFFSPSTDKQSLAPVRSTRGVSSIVRFGAELAALRPEVVGAIREQEARQNQEAFESADALQAGSHVRVRHPALQGLEGLVQSASTRRVLLLMEILGRQATVRLAPEQVELA